MHTRSLTYRLSATAAWLCASLFAVQTLAAPAAPVEPLVIQEQGSFAIGGTVVHAPGSYDPRAQIAKKHAHELLSHTDEIMDASVIIVLAGMEGALASVVAGLADCPVIAVPTSVGYGASYSGLAALLSMLNSCASGVSVVNIDNGFGAAFQASAINHLNLRRS